MRLDDRRPWPASYPEGRPPSLRPEHPSLLAMVAAAVESAPDAPAVHHFGTTYTWAQLDRASDSPASLLLARGFAPGDRLALYLQNDPAFVIGLVAAWKAGGVAVLVSPMSKAREFELAVRDYAPSALLALDDLYEDVARDVLQAGDTDVRTVITVSAVDGLDDPDPRLFADVTIRSPSAPRSC